ncbi:MAG: LTA synthase family protein, partial [Chloroflexota bacterium]|nr:LTA synthase family protein [Chloroflexota bacterium]
IVSTTLASLLLLSALLILVPRVSRLVVLLWVDLALTLLAIASFLHYRFFGDVLSISDLYVAHQLPVVVPSIVRQLHPIDALYILELVAGILILPGYVLACRRRPALGRTATRRLSLGVLVSALVLALPTVLLVRQDKDDIFAQSTLRYEVASTIGILPYHLFDAALSLGSGARHVGPEELRRVGGLLDEQRSPSPSELFGSAGGRNVILISLESLQAFPIGLEVNGQPIAPRLAALARESLYFENFHDQTHLGTTSDAEFMALNSLHPLPARALANKHLDNHFHALPAILGERGYATASTVASPGGIWQMDRLHPRYGFQRSYFEDSYTIGEHFGEWASDREFFSQAVPILEAQPEPFMTFMLSSANHHPYPIPEHHRMLDLGELEGTLLGDYLQSAHFLDRALGEFVDTLRERGLLDRSVLVLYGDHHGFLGDSPEVARLLGFPERSEFDHLRTRKRVPFLIRLPHGEAAGVRDVTAGHLDIAPTILSLLGVTAEDRVMLGRDLTGDRPSLVVFRDGSFADGAHYFVNRLGPISAATCYEAATGQAVDCQPLAERRLEARRRLEASDLIIEGDLIPSLAARRDRHPVLAGSAP